MVTTFGEAQASVPVAEPVRVLRLAMRIAVTMLSNGAQAEDVEASIGHLARAYDVGGVQAAVSFSMISISRYTHPDEPPTTLLHLVRDRRIDFTRLASRVGDRPPHPRGQPRSRGGGVGRGPPRLRHVVLRSGRPVRGPGAVGRRDDTDVRWRPARGAGNAGDRSRRPAGARGARPLQPPALLPSGHRRRRVGDPRGTARRHGTQHRWRARADRQPAPLPARLRAGVRLP